MNGVTSGGDESAFFSAGVHTEAIHAITADNRDEVEALTEKALASGGSPANDPYDLGFMYGRSFNDPDGHQWEVFWMDPVAAEKRPQAFAEAASTS